MSIAHKGDIHHWIADKYPDGVTGWRSDNTCEYCGSLHPATVVAALEGGATIHFADMKYGWPHKAYLDNPWGKFYTRHLIDATPEQYAAICRALKTNIVFSDDGKNIAWGPFKPVGGA